MIFSNLYVLVLPSSCHITCVILMVCSLQDKPDYDKLFGEMALDMRARASDRTKAPEELAQEEKERLEQLEVII